MSKQSVILKVTQAGLAADRYYGPFANLDSADEWIAKQPSGVNFIVIPLRTPDVVRNTDDFFNPRLDDPDRDVGTHTRAATTNA